MVKIWRNRIEAGTQKLGNCPQRYRSGVIEYIQADLKDGSYTLTELHNLVEIDMMTPEEYKEISGEPYKEKK